jgi:hypothetical protein
LEDMCWNINTGQHLSDGTIAFPLDTLRLRLLSSVESERKNELITPPTRPSKYGQSYIALAYEEKMQTYRERKAEYTFQKRILKETGIKSKLVGKLLRGLGFTTKVVREGSGTYRAVVFTRQQLKDVADRYRIEQPSSDTP